MKNTVEITRFQFKFITHLYDQQLSALRYLTITITIIPRISSQPDG